MTEKELTFGGYFLSSPSGRSLILILSYLAVHLFSFLFFPRVWGILSVPLIAIVLFVELAVVCRYMARGAPCRLSTNLNGKTVLITGGTAGIGKATAAILGKMGAQIIITCRDEKRGADSVDEIKQKIGKCRNDQVQCMSLDLSSFESIRAFAKAYEKKGLPLDILINNAGVMMCPYSQTQDGLEMQMGTNHFGHFLLTKLLLPIIKRSRYARIVNLSSSAHLFCTEGIDYSLIANPATYDKKVAYGMSKLANILFSKELQRRLDEEGSRVTVCSVHPGAVRTELGRHFGAAAQFISNSIGLLVLKTPEEGAQTSVYCAVAPDLVPGGYYLECHAGLTNKAGRDEEGARKLWDLSEQLTKPKAQ